MLICLTVCVSVRLFVCPHDYIQSRPLMNGFAQSLSKGVTRERNNPLNFEDDPHNDPDSESVLQSISRGGSSD